MLSAKTHEKNKRNRPEVLNTARFIGREACGCVFVAQEAELPRGYVNTSKVRPLKVLVSINDEI